MKWMWSRTARAVYILQFVVLAAPVIVVLGYLALMLGVVSSGALLIGSPAVLTFDLVGLQMAGLGAVGLALSVSGIAALRHFVVVSISYIHGAAEALPSLRRRYRHGLAFAAAPMVVLGLLSLETIFSGSSPLRVLLFFVCGTMTVPVLYLGAALHRDRRDAAA